MQDYQAQSNKLGGAHIVIELMWTHPHNMCSCSAIQLAVPQTTQRSQYQHSPRFSKPDCVDVGVKLSRESHLRLRLDWRLGYSHDFKVEG